MTIAHKWKLFLGQTYLAVIFGVLFLIGTGLVSDWGRWYSERTYYREQTDAILGGSLGLHSAPAALRNDLAWHSGAVQQVWGLGVPCWRLPFELLSRVFGQPGFPDRLAFTVAMILVALLVFRILLHSSTTKNESMLDSMANPFRLAGVLVLLLFPPLVNMCRIRFDVYEEAVAYAYLFGLGLFVGLVSFVRNPGKQKLCLLSTLAGIAPLVRPTLIAYSIPTMLLLMIYSWKVRLGSRYIIAGCCMCSLGFLVLFFTNYIRFGSGFEFGHNLNLNGFPIWFFTRIYNPFQHEPVLSAARELFGSLFCNPPLNSFDWNRKDFFWGQSATPRWRHFYLTCFDLSFFVLLAVSWAAVFWGYARRSRNPFRLAPEFKIAGLWSLIGVACLTVFYLRAPVFSNRYALDFGPGFAVAIAGLLFGLERVCLNSKIYKRFISWCLLGVTVAWICSEICIAKTNASPSPALTQAEAMALIRREYPEPELPINKYSIGDNLGLSQIPYNGSGWSESDGRMNNMVVLFVADPEYLELHLGQVDRNRPADCSKVEAKIGLEFLTKKSMVQNEDECIIVFEQPKRLVYQKGIQVVFIAYVDRNDLSSEMSPLRLTKVTWKP